jgi:hypothetical protein
MEPALADLYPILGSGCKRAVAIVQQELWKLQIFIGFNTESS